MLPLIALLVLGWTNIQATNRALGSPIFAYVEVFNNSAEGATAVPTYESTLLAESEQNEGLPTATVLSITANAFEEISPGSSPPPQASISAASDLVSNSTKRESVETTAALSSTSLSEAQNVMSGAVAADDGSTAQTHSNSTISTIQISSTYATSEAVTPANSTISTIETNSTFAASAAETPVKSTISTIQTNLTYGLPTAETSADSSGLHVVVLASMVPIAAVFVIVVFVAVVCTAAKRRPRR